jgi:hypothetical protein
LSASMRFMVPFLRGASNLRQATQSGVWIDGDGSTLSEACAKGRRKIFGGENRDFCSEIAHSGVAVQFTKAKQNSCGLHYAISG